MEIDLTYKIAIIGDCRVGKTSIIHRSVYGDYSDKYIKTLAVGYCSKVFRMDNKNIKLNIWDLSGEYSYRTVVKAYLRHVHGIIFVYDVTNRESFKNIEDWLKLVNEIENKKTTKLLLANKIDKINNRNVGVDDGVKYAMKNNMIYLDVSAKNCNLMNFLKIFTEFIMDTNEEKTLFENTKLCNKENNNKYFVNENTLKTLNDVESCDCNIS